MNNFWHFVAQFTLKNRVAILVVITVLTGLMFWASGSELAQDYGKIVPPSDSEFKIYQNFKKEFGDDGNVIAIGVEGNHQDLAFFNDLYDLVEEIKQVKGVDGAVAYTHLFNIIEAGEEDSSKRFEVVKIVKEKPSNQATLDSLSNIITQLPFYKGLILSDDGKTSLIAVNMNVKELDSGGKVRIFDALKAAGAKFEAKQKTSLYYAGLPVLRVTLFKILPRELALFLGLAVLVTAIILFIFFRSFIAVLSPILVVGVIIVWAMGILGILDYKMTVVTGIIPALITVVGIPNCVYLITKYHQEFAATRNKHLALTHVIEKIGLITVMVNATTVVGLGATAVTDIAILREFGIVAGLTVTVAFFISMLLIPILFSYLPEPTDKELKHIERKSTDGILLFIDRMVHEKRTVIYTAVILFFGFSIWGMTRIKVESRMVDDIPKGSQMLSDMAFMEEKFKGSMPFEILVDTKKARGAMSLSVLKDIARLQDSMKKYPEISRTLSIADFTKFARQTFSGGAEADYDLPSRSEFNFIRLYLKNSKVNVGGFSKALVDSNMQKTRISGNIRDIGSRKMGILIQKLQTDIDSIFQKNPEAEKQTEVHITGTTRIYIKGNEYLVKNLVQSLALTLLLIGVLMWLMFRNVSGVLLSIIPNILPLLMVAGYMGFANVPLKPSTALIFSVVFGIAIDNTIHFLASYRRHRKSGLNVSDGVTATFRTTGLSMIYTSSILFFGFAIFIASSFGGTQALGYLMGCTLLMALFSNLFFLPAMVLTFGRDDEKPIEDMTSEIS